MSGQERLVKPMIQTIPNDLGDIAGCFSPSKFGCCVVLGESHVDSGQRARFFILMYTSFHAHPFGLLWFGYTAFS